MVYIDNNKGNELPKTMEDYYRQQYEKCKKALDRLKEDMNNLAHKDTLILITLPIVTFCLGVILGGIG